MVVLGQVEPLSGDSSIFRSPLLSVDKARALKITEVIVPRSEDSSKENSALLTFLVLLAT